MVNPSILRSLILRGKEGEATECIQIKDNEFFDSIAVPRAWSGPCNEVDHTGFSNRPRSRFARGPNHDDPNRSRSHRCYKIEMHRNGALHERVVDPSIPRSLTLRGRERKMRGHCTCLFVRPGWCCAMPRSLVIARRSESEWAAGGAAGQHRTDAGPYPPEAAP